MNLSEKGLVKKIIEKDEQAFNFFYHQHEKSIFNFIKRKIYDEGIAREITQEVFLSFLEGLRDFHFHSSLKTYLYSIAKNKVIDYYRKNKIKKILFSHLPSFLVEGINVFLMEDEIERKEVKERIEKVFRLLPKDYQGILRLKYIEKIKIKQIAKKLKLTFKATESLLFRARKAFVKLYQSI